jgi:hypothetical protein
MYTSFLDDLCLTSRIATVGALGVEGRSDESFLFLLARERTGRMRRRLARRSRQQARRRGPGFPEGPLHRPGQPCVTCHGAERPAESSSAWRHRLPCLRGQSGAGGHVLIGYQRGRGHNPDERVGTF